jgi:anaphase-promoting complex subunit 1
VLEGTSINVDITAPGAVLALALLYLKSRDRTVATRIDIPDTQFAFQYLRPDLVLLRVLAKNLILWDDIQPEAAWIEAQVPSVMTGVKAQLGRASDSDADQTLRQGYINVLTGACLAMGMRFAGTAHSAAKHVLTQYLQFFVKLQKSKFERADKNMLEYCMNSVALALCMVMSGTGHLGTFKCVYF